jgi:hypothetical protein
LTSFAKESRVADPRWLVGAELWRSLRKLAAGAKQRRWLAVAYLGPEAEHQFPLQAGDRVVVALSPSNVMGRRVDPRVLAGWAKKGVMVSACPELHAKVYLFDDAVVVGSANASWSSESTLLEAALFSRDPVVVRQVEEWFRSLGDETVGDAVLEAYVRQAALAPKTRWSLESLGPPRKKEAGPVDGQDEARRDGMRPAVWLCRISDRSGGGTLQDEAEAELARAQARRDLKRAQGTTLDTLTWAYVGRMGNLIVPGDMFIYAWPSARGDRVGVGGRLLLRPKVVRGLRRPGLAMVTEVPGWTAELESEVSMSWRAFRKLAKAAGVDVGAREPRSKILTDRAEVGRRLFRAVEAELRP